MSDLIRREDAYAAIRGLTRHIDRIAAITALPAVQPDAREAALREAEKALRKWQAGLTLCGYKEAPITVGMAADLVLDLIDRPAVQPDDAAIREAALREAASYHELLAADEDALSAKYRGGSNPWFAHVQRASWHREHASAILALNGESHE